MAENILESYFVKVGALPDMTSFAALGVQLIKTGKAVGTFSESSAKEIVKLGAAANASFVAMGVGLVALADRTAMADQSYRLLGLRMLLTKQSARAMQLSLDALGATLDEVAYDPELNKRFQYLYEQNIKLGRLLGEDFDQITYRMRDIRMEYKRFGTEVEFAVWATVTKLFSKLGFNEDSFLRKLQDINEWFSNKIPDISDKVSQFLIPVWDEAVVVTENLGKDLKEVGADFTWFTGIISGDKSLEETKGSIEDLTNAILWWTNTMAQSILMFSLWRRYVTHGFKAIIEAGKGALEGGPMMDPEDAAKSYGMSKQEFARWWADIEAMWNTEDKETNPDYQAIVELHRRMEQLQKGREFKQEMQTQYPEGDLHKYIKDMLENRYKNVPPAVLNALIGAESSWNPYAVPRDPITGKLESSASGLMQIIKATREQYHLSDEDRFDPYKNIEAGTHYLSDMFAKYPGDLASGLMAYHEGQQGFEDWKKLDTIAQQLINMSMAPGQNEATDRALAAQIGLKSGRIYDDFEKNLREIYGEEEGGGFLAGVPGPVKAEQYVQSILKANMRAQQEIGAGKATGDTIINGMTIIVPPHFTEDQAKALVHEIYTENKDKATKANQAQVAGGSYH